MSGAASEPLNAADWLLDRHVREGRGERVAIAGVGQPVTYAELARRTARVSAALQALGVAPGDRVLLALPDSPEFIACFLGALRLGAIAVPVNTWARAAEFAFYAGDCRPGAAVVHAACFAEALPALQQANPAPRLLTLGKSASGAERLEDLVAHAEAKQEAHPSAADDPAFLLYTSGSGGQPKAAIHRHGHLPATTESYARGVLGIKDDDVFFSASKLFFAYGLGNGLTFPLSVGAATVLLPDRTTPERLLAVLKAHRPTLFFAVPTVYGALLHVAETAGDAFASVRLAVSAGEGLPAELFEQFHSAFALDILDGIGATEMLHMFISHRPGEACGGSCGREVPGYEARLLDDGGEPMPDEQIGTLWVRGPSTFAGYWEKPELTESALRDGWFVTGDKFSRDAQGFYHYCGRGDDMLKIAGLWVSPMEVENLLLAHEAVAEAAVVGRHGADGLTHVVAFVVLHKAGQGSAALSEELRAFLRPRLPGYKVPQQIHFVPNLPKTATGKIQRYKLRS